MACRKPAEASSSLCSSTLLRANLDGSRGCLELLTDLHNNFHYTISILANNWYLGMDNRVNYPAGITITISRSHKVISFCIKDELINRLLKQVLFLIAYEYPGIASDDYDWKNNTG